MHDIFATGPKANINPEWFKTVREPLDNMPRSHCIISALNEPWNTSWGHVYLSYKLIFYKLLKTKSYNENKLISHITFLWLGNRAIFAKAVIWNMIQYVNIKMNIT